MVDHNGGYELTQEILLVAPFAESVVKFRGDLIRALISRDVLVHVAVPGASNAPELRTEIEDTGARVHEVPFSRTGINPFSDLFFLWKLYVLMRKIRPNYLLAYTIKPVIFGSIAARFAKIPNCYALITGLGHSFAAGGSAILGVLVPLLYRVALSKVSAVFFQNPDDQALFRDRNIIGDNRHSLVVNGSGVNLAEFSEMPIPERRVNFLMISRLLGSKGVREYAAAAGKLRASGEDARYRLVGWIDDGPDAIAKNEIDAWVSEGTIEYLGKLSDVRPAIADSSVFLLPSSYREGTPRTILEAMAMARPIITTDAPGCRETVIDGENGFLVPVNSVEALVEAMQKFLDDSNLAARMGRRSREIAEQKFDVRKVNAVMLHEMGIE